MLRLFGCSILVFSGFCFADDWSVISQSAKTSQSQPFSGTYVRQLGDGLQTFLIHRTNDQGRVIERRIATDGVPREIMRSNRHLRFFAKTEKAIELARLDGFRLFPLVLPEDTGAASISYNIKKGTQDRIAGRPCQWYDLLPKDKQRYIQKYCLDDMNAMPLKMLVLLPNSRTVEQNSFTQIGYETPTKAQMQPNPALILKEDSRLPPSFAISGKGPGSQGHKGARGGHGMNPSNLTGLPAGFKVLAARQVKMPQNEQPSTHYILGDGLITVSLFIEPQEQAKVNETMTVNGALMMSRVYRDGLRLTAIGDMPASGLEQLLLNLKLN